MGQGAKQKRQKGEQKQIGRDRRASNKSGNKFVFVRFRRHIVDMKLRA